MKKVYFLLLIIVVFNSCKKEEQSFTTKFTILEKSVSKINFSNTIIENDTLNYFNFPYLYLGAGVSTGDINNDGLPDLYFTGNLTSNKLYLNKGNLEFEDITESAGIAGDNRWYSGTTMADVNNDGYLDIYLSVSGKFTNTANQLFINNGDNTFTEQAEQYGIADKSISIQSTFFDYDQDGLLDLFVANYPNVLVSMGNLYYKHKMDENKYEDSGHLYKNNGNGTFTDVTAAAGVQKFGLTLGLISSDFNNDGFSDLYLSNDFNVPDYMYQNNGDGTFTEISKKSTRHTSMFGMGIDAADFNNDELIDFLQVDMTAEDYKRSKTNMASMSPETFYEAIDLGFNHQYMQNSLQLNNGFNNGTPVFSDISRFAGMATTDWSWGAMFMDLDNDGWKDVFISNGVKRDVNNNDVNETYRTTSLFGNNKKQDYSLMPSTPISNYVFKNNSDYTFTNSTKDWGLSKKGFSNGFVYSDLDNDGDLDLIINNIDIEASVYVNNAENNNNNYLKIKLIGEKHNPNGLGAKILVKTPLLTQTQELTLTKGYQSSVAPILHFGLGTSLNVEEVIVLWPNQKKQILHNIKPNQLIKISYDSILIREKKEESIVTKSIFKNITEQLELNYEHKEDSYNDFTYEPLLPHKNSKIGPGIAVGDVNGDDLEDFFVGNAAGSSGKLFIQNKQATFDVVNGVWEEDAKYEDTDALFFDADADGDLDLYVVSGGNNVNVKEQYYQDRLYINTENGFIKTSNTLPKITTSGSKVISGDYDNDGDLDLFIGGRIVPGKYPYPSKSHILRNDGGKDLNLKYTEVTKDIAPQLLEAGLVTAAIWDDFNNDGALDLIITGEWMPIRFFKNLNGSFKEVTHDLSLDQNTGWWYSLEKVDIDADGDMDYFAGNLGLNYKYKATDKESFEVYANDFDQNGSSDIVLSYKKDGKKLPLRGRECSSEQIPVIKKRFKTFESFANADLNTIYGEQVLENSLHYKVNSFAHQWIENKGNGTYEMHKLPNETQFSSINKFKQFNYNGDEYPDLMIAGNLYESEVETPRNDASIGLVITGGENGVLRVVKPSESNLFVLDEIKDIKTIKIGDNKEIEFILAPNDKKLKILSFK